MNMQSSKILPKLFLPLRTNVFEILVPKYHHPSLRNQQRQLVLLRIAQLRQLQAPDLCTDARRESAYADVRVICSQQVRLLLVRIKAAVVMLERLGCGKLGRRVVDGEVGFVA